MGSPRVQENRPSTMHSLHWPVLAVKNYNKNKLFLTMERLFGLLCSAVAVGFGLLVKCKHLCSPR